MIDLELLERLNAGTPADRLLALQAALSDADFPAIDPRMINNHIHTKYSFSPYSPTAAVYAARKEGLCTAGIVDHDSIAGAREFIEAGKIIDMPVTVGIEARASMVGTPFEALRTNNPDQIGVSYMVLHGVPHENIETVQEYFTPRRALRNIRNMKMLERINRIAGVELDFERDVIPLSNYRVGGTITERHLMLALAKELIRLGREPGGDMFQEYDLVGRLKKEFIPKIYVDATDECPTLHEYITLAKDVGGILCYAYLGDVTASVTGDKKAQKFEDDNLDMLFETLHTEGIRAVTYMPTRNTPAQLTRLRALCERYGMFQISGEDINSPRQKFVIEAMREEQFSNLIDSTWALIAHESGEKRIEL